MTKYILKVARREGVSPEEVYAQIQAAIAAAWSTTDPGIVHAQIKLTGGRSTPSPEEIISLISSKILDKS